MTTIEQLRALVRAATMAPSVHNTQPWRFEVSDDSVELYADTDRQLGVLDADGRQLHLSCGAALLHLRVAARALALDASVGLLPDRENPLHLASVRVTEGEPARPEETALAAAVEHRQTHRDRFQERPLSASLLEQLRLAAEAEGGWLRPVDDQDELLALEVLLSRADRSEQDDPDYREELARWVSPGGREDGISTGSLPADPERGSSLRLRDFAMNGAGPAAGASPPAEHPDVLVLFSRDDTPASWLRTGMSLGAVLLYAAAAGVQAQPLGQLTDRLDFRHRLATVLGLIGSPQLVLRAGFVDASSTADSSRASSRRQLPDVLDLSRATGAGGA